MKKFLIGQLVILWLFGQLSAQSSLTFENSQGYKVTYTLSFAGLEQVSGGGANCQNGFNYKVRINYDISFDPAVIPTSYNGVGIEPDCAGNTYLGKNLGLSGSFLSPNNYANESLSSCSEASISLAGCTEIDLVPNGGGNFTPVGGSGTVSLPVELVAFSALPNRKSVRLDWITATESDNDRFEIERSSDLRQWQTLHIVNGQGTTAAATQYTFNDQDPLTGQSYYRLRQVDVDGTENLSFVVSVNFGEDRAVFYPNPTTGNLRTTIETEQSPRVFTPLGQEVSAQISLRRSNQELELDLSQLPTGFYYLQVGDYIQQVIKR